MAHTGGQFDVIGGAGYWMKMVKCQDACPVHTDACGYVNAIAEGRDEVGLSAAILQYYADHAEEFLKPQAIDAAIGDAYLESSPLGVLLGVQPWNFPYYQLSRFVAPNLMASNVLLVKHSSSVPQCALAFEQIFTDAGAPRGAYTNLLSQVGRLGP